MCDLGLPCGKPECSFTIDPNVKKYLEQLEGAKERLRIASDRDHTDMYFGDASPVKSADIRLVLEALDSR